MKKIIFLLSILIVCPLLLGQDLPVIPPSPNAASLGQYADIPVSNYTGIPNISIPLSNITSGDINLPISLSYHASGIKVAQEASWVGLGWSLNAGGVITKQTRGLDDFDGLTSRGYMFSGSLPPSTQDNYADFSQGTYSSFYNSLKDGDIDGEPDIFYYNFLGYSGKLYFEKQVGNEVEGTPLNQNNLKFIYNTQTESWIITDGNGFKYFFEVKEYTTNYSISSSSIEAPLIDDLTYDQDNNKGRFVSSWFLSKIVSTKNHEINFFYDDDEHRTLSQIQYYEKKFNLLNVTDSVLQQGGSYFTPSLIPNAKHNLSQQVTEDIYLERIEFDNGSLVFSTEDRIDMRIYEEPSYTVLNPQKLDYIELFDSDYKLKKKIDLNYSYINENLNIVENKENYLRLRLNSIQEFSNDLTSAKPPYEFIYNSSYIPEKTSYKKDHWGYYNNKNNNSVRHYDHRNMASHIDSPTFSQFTPTAPSNTYKMLSPYYNDFDTGVYLFGADREVNPSTMQTSILTNIKNPLGAVTNFNYELNDYYSESEVLYKNTPEEYVATFIEGEIYEDSFSLTHDTMVYFNVDASDSYESYDVYNNPLDSLVLGLEQTGNHLIFSIVPEQNDIVNSHHFSKFFSVFLPPGSYTLRANDPNHIQSDYNSKLDLKITANFVRKEATNKKKGAGLRIESIEVLDNNSVKRKSFKYEENGVSTGRLMSYPLNFLNETIILQKYEIFPGSVTNYLYYFDYLIQTSTSQIPLGSSAQGSSIGYDKVIVYKKDTLGNTLGRSEYSYKNEEEAPAELFIPGTPNTINLSNGQLLKEEHFNDLGNVIKTRVINYNQNLQEKKSIKGVKAYDVGGITTNFKIRFYDVFSEWWHPIAETETIYDIDGNNPITTVTNYEYSNPDHKNITKTETTNSNQENIVTIKEYASDYPSETGMSVATLDKMVEKNMLNNVIKQQIKVDNEILSTLVNSYHIWDVDNDSATNDPDDLILPDFIKIAKGANPLENKISFVSYYANGNIKEVKKTDGTTTVYIWGYNEVFPIAKIENTSSSEVTVAFNSISNTNYNTLEKLQTLSNNDDDSCLNTESCDEKNLQDALNALRNELPDASQMTSFTYDPLIGVTSITDQRGETVYYEYDDFNRLKQVKDANGKIFSENEYHYKGQ